MKFLRCAIIYFAISLPAYAADKSNYIAPDLISPDLISKPYTVDSPELKKELEAVRLAQSNASNKAYMNALLESRFKAALLFDAMGDDFDEDDYPKTIELLDKAVKDCKAIVAVAKNHWKIKRPYQIDSTISAHAKFKGDPAYPSGHTACSKLTAEILGSLAPAKRDDLRKRASEMANNRMIAGMHFPQDLRGGLELSNLILGAMINSAAFQQDFKQAEKEFK